MNRRLVTIAATLAAACGAAPASAATLALGLDTFEDPGGMKGLGIARNGTVLIGITQGHFLQRFAARLVADDGTPVSGCLSGARLELIVRGTNAVRARSGGCAGGDGLFEMRPVGENSIQTPQFVVARVATSSSGGHRISATRSNAVRVKIAPRLVNESPTSSPGTRRYPVRIRVNGPPAARRGVVVILRKRGATWTRIARRVPDATGRIRTSVAIPAPTNVFTFRFVPARGTGYIPASIRMRIDRAGQVSSALRRTGRQGALASFGMRSITPRFSALATRR